MEKDLEKQDDPFHIGCLLFAFTAVFAILIGLYFQDPEGFVDWLTTAGMCLGAVLLVFFIGMIYGAVINIKSKKSQEQHMERLKQHQASFYCHICGKPSPQPYQDSESYGENGRIYGSYIVIDYNKPTELVQCAQCQKWTCPDADPPHLENGICKKCLEIKPEQV